MAVTRVVVRTLVDVVQCAKSIPEPFVVMVCVAVFVVVVVATVRIGNGGSTTSVMTVVMVLMLPFVVLKTVVGTDVVMVRVRIGGIGGHLGQIVTTAWVGTVGPA